MLIFNKKEFSIEKYVLKTQKWITLALFASFIAMLIWSLVVASNSTSTLNSIQGIERIINSFLPIITGWIGVVLGFYFSREISNLIEDRLKSVKSQTEQALEEAQKNILELEKKRKEELDNAREEFKTIITKKNKELKDLKEMIGKLLERLNNYRNHILSNKRFKNNYGKNKK
jgi:hypothetical protein